MDTENETIPLFATYYLFIFMQYANEYYLDVCCEVEIVPVNHFPVSFYYNNS